MKAFDNQNLSLSLHPHFEAVWSETLQTTHSKGCREKQV